MHWRRRAAFGGQRTLIGVVVCAVIVCLLHHVLGTGVVFGAIEVRWPAVAARLLLPPSCVVALVAKDSADWNTMPEGRAWTEHPLR